MIRGYIYEYFCSRYKNSYEPDPDENVFKLVWNQYERVIIESLITSFGLDWFIKDQVGGDVDTVHNVRNMKDEKGEEKAVKAKTEKEKSSSLQDRISKKQSEINKREAIKDHPTKQNPAIFCKKDKNHDEKSY